MQYFHGGLCASAFQCEDMLIRLESAVFTLGHDDGLAGRYDLKGCAFVGSLRLRNSSSCLEQARRHESYGKEHGEKSNCQNQKESRLRLPLY